MKIHKVCTLVFLCTIFSLSSQALVSQKSQRIPSKNQAFLLPLLKNAPQKTKPLAKNFQIQPRP
jgi:hypothetical protein